MDKALDVLNKFYGFSDFRPGQKDVIKAAISGKDILAVLPTGGGKSICYQVPSLLKEGTCIVISPIISLMYDQVSSLQKKGISSYFINSTMTKEDQENILLKILNGEAKFIYVAPERFKNEDFLSVLKKIKISLFAIDEAHCISQWGHEFRPEYSKIKYFLSEVEASNIFDKKIQKICLTATATPEVREEIINLSGLLNPEIIVNGFDRPNLFFNIHHSSSKKDTIINLVLKMKGDATIVYCSSREKVDNCFNMLSKIKSLNVAKYHAGMNKSDRIKSQDGFLEDKYNILVATNAFGMGVDKPNVRSVIHYDMPGSMEAYYQEAGRAGRDGKNAECHLVYSLHDRRIHESFLNSTIPPKDIIKSFKNIIDEWPYDNFNININSIQVIIPSFKPSMIKSIYDFFENSGVIQTTNLIDIDGNINREAEIIGRFKNIDNQIAILAKRRIARSRSLEVMERYSQGETCLINYMLNYFGEHNDTPCGRCDSCKKHYTSLKNKNDYSDQAKIIINIIKKDFNFKMKKDLLFKISYGIVDSSTLITKAFLLKNFGKLSYLGSEKTKEFIDYLIDNQYLIYNGDTDEYLYISNKGLKVLENKNKIFIEKGIFKTMESPSNEVNSSIGFSKKLELLRQEIAEEEFIAPFMVWSPKIAQDIINIKPNKISDLSKIEGLNKHKIEAFGSRIINIFK